MRLRFLTTVAWWTIGGAALAAAALALFVLAFVRAGEAPSRYLVLLFTAAFVVAGAAARALGFVSWEGAFKGLTVIAAFATVVTLFAVVAPEPEVRLAGAPLCEAVSGEGKGRAFTADLDDGPYAALTESNEGRGVVYRGAANTGSDFDVRGRLLPPNCLVAFEGFCIGEPVVDLSDRDGPLDQQWFILPDDEGYVAGGVVQEIAPGTIGETPTECRDGESEPRSIELASPMPPSIREPTTFEFVAPDAITVGLAAFYRSNDEPPEWQQVGLDTSPGDGFAVSWDPTAIAPQADVTIYYSVCWAGNVPGKAGRAAVIDLDTGDPDGELPSTPIPGVGARDGATVACRSPGGGA